MPYSSAKQRRFMWAKHPEIAKKWQAEGHGNVDADALKLARDGPPKKQATLRTRKKGR